MGPVRITVDLQASFNSNSFNSEEVLEGFSLAGGLRDRARGQPSGPVTGWLLHMGSGHPQYTYYVHTRVTTYRENIRNREGERGRICIV